MLRTSDYRIIMEKFYFKKWKNISKKIYKWFTRAYDWIIFKGSLGMQFGILNGKIHTWINIRGEWYL